MFFVREFIRQARAGGGFTLYSFEKPGAGVQPKLSYTRLIPGTDVLIGTGVYIDGVDMEKNRLREDIRAENRHYRFILLQVLAILLVTMALAVYIIRSITRPLREVTKTADAIADGNLAAKACLGKHIPKEIRSMYGMLERMLIVLREKIEAAARSGREAEAGMLRTQEALTQAEEARAAAETARRDGMMAAAEHLTASVEVISSASRELSAGIMASEQGAAEQSARITDTVAAIEALNATMLEVAENTEQAADISATTRQKAEAGAQVVEKAVNAIHQVRKESLKLKEDMATLGGHAQSISQIMSVISDIADQTNLLALNAAIEAARAGEAGRGFAVVADEVRKLAEKTMASTTDVGNAITSIQNSAEQSMAQVDLAVQAIEKTTDFANQSGAALTEIVSMADATAAQIRGIATTSRQQSASSRQIHQSVGQVHAIAVTTTEEMAKASQAVGDLARQTELLTKLIENMKRG